MADINSGASGARTQHGAQSSIKPRPRSQSVGPPTGGDSPPSMDAGGPVDPLKLPVAARRTVLLLMGVLKVATSFDAGAFSIAVGAAGGIASDMALNDAQSGFLGASVYMGNVIGCASCAWLFRSYSAKYLLCASMLLHAVFTVLFALCGGYFFAVLARIGIGFTLAFVVVYSVVWADVFSPKANATLWLAVLNIGVPVGTLAGFLAGAIIMNTLAYSWRWVFFVKALCMVPVIVFMAHVDPVLLDDPQFDAPSAPSASPPPGDAIEAAGDRDAVSTDVAAAPPASPVERKTVVAPALDVWMSFFSNKLMILNVAGLSVLYFVVTGMQVFFTQYLRDPPFNATVSDIMLSFGFTAVTAPIAGVALGGIAMDKLGNYREHPDVAADLSAAAGALAAIFGVFTTMSTTVAMLSVNLWLMLFFGAGALPSAMGLIVASVQPGQKNAASSFANIMFNVWGYFAGPLFCGFVAQATGSLRVAMGATLNMGWIGVFFFWWSSRVAKSIAQASAAAAAAAASASAPSSSGPLEATGPAAPAPVPSGSSDAVIVTVVGSGAR